jgi:predicted RNA-binding protein Jag
VDERRHNMDGALFVDDERPKSDDRRPARTKPRVDDEKAEDARRVTQAILDRMELHVRAEIREDDEQVVLNLDGEDAGRVIGKKGQTLEALQFLVNKIVNRDLDERRHIVLDSGNYRERHDNSLISMARREAKRAISSGRVVTLEPMSARDRRVIHVSLAEFTGVSTRSEGEGADRRLQIIPAREGGGGGRGDDRPPRDRDRGPRGRGPRRDDRPRDDRPRDDRPRDDRPRDDRPRDDRPRDDRPRDDRPRDDRPRDDRPRDDRPRDDRPRDDRPRDDRPRRDDAPRSRDDAPRSRDDAPRSRDDAPRSRDDAPRSRDDDRNR